MFISFGRSVISSYRNLAIVFMTMTLVLTVVRGIYHDVFGSAYLTYLAPSVAPFGILFLMFMVRLVNNLGVRKEFVKLLVVLLLSAIIMRVFTIFVADDPQVKFVLSVLSSSFLLILQGICVYFMCINLFLDSNPIQEKLWASVCVYFMLAATFGTIYSIIGIVNPNSFGVQLNNPMEVYILGLVYSFNVVSGLDPIYEHTSETMRMTAVLESICSMLFMVILIGRLLGSKD